MHLFSSQISLGGDMQELNEGLQTDRNSFALAVIPQGVTSPSFVSCFTISQTCNVIDFKQSFQYSCEPIYGYN